jgi:magnesium transporter
MFFGVLCVLCGGCPVITIFTHRNGRTERATSIDRTWLNPAAGVTFWVDLQSPSIPESLILSDTMAFHPLSVEDAMSAVQFPKVEAYDGYLYVVLHAIDFKASGGGFKTHDVDFFLGPTYLVTVHDGRSLSIADLLDHCLRNVRILSDGPVPLFHRIVDAMVDHYRPEIEKLEDRLDELEAQVFQNPSSQLAREILEEKRDVSSLRRVTTPQRDVIARLARREFIDISTEMAFRFRDVHDHLVRIADDAMLFQDRITGILDAHLSNTSNRLNEVMKVLTVLATIFMPLTLLTGMYGMNVDLPHFPGGAAAQFWWLFAIMIVTIVVMLVLFRRKHWI